MFWSRSTRRAGCRRPWQALAKLDTRPTRLIAIDNASADATPDVLDDACRHGVLDAVYQGERIPRIRGRESKPLWTVDAANLQDDADTIGFRAVSVHDTHWLWLLHDDAVPAPDALYQLLAHVTIDPSIDLTGPKLLLPRHRHGGQPISEVGVSISDTGRRELELDVDEIDQGQRDEPQERLGVSTCGMLVRSAVWERLDGLDPALPVFRDGVEFGWRAHLNGYSVVTTPSAQVTHRQVGRAGLRPHGLTGRGRARSIGCSACWLSPAMLRARPCPWCGSAWSGAAWCAQSVTWSARSRAGHWMRCSLSARSSPIPDGLLTLRKRTTAIEPRARNPRGG